MEPNRFTNTLSFLDMLFLTLIGFVFLFVVAFMMMNPPEAKKVESKAELLVTMTWDDYNPHDIDVWSLLPLSTITDLRHAEPTIGFLNMKAGMVHLDRDDRGYVNDRIVTEQGVIMSPTNREVMSWRGLPSGTYTINAHFYRSYRMPDDPTPYDGDSEIENEPVEVTIELIKLNPRYTLLKKVKITLFSPGHEMTAFSFTIDENGEVFDINTTERLFINDSIIADDGMGEW